jgi:hypothetical protein
MFFLVTLVTAEVGGQKPTVVKLQLILYPYMPLKLFQIILSLKPISTT